MLKVTHENVSLVPCAFKQIEVGHPFIFCGATMIKTSNRLAHNLNVGKLERFDLDMKVNLVQYVHIQASEPKG